MIVACVAAPVNVNDSALLPEALAMLEETAERLGVSCAGVPLTLDSGFDSKENDRLIKEAGMTPVIKPNFRNTKDKRIIARRTRAFKKRETIYKRRHVVERSFAWEDKYRKLVIRYERLEATFNGFRYLAATMVNYRITFGKSL